MAGMHVVIHREGQRDKGNGGKKGEREGKEEEWRKGGRKIGRMKERERICRHTPKTIQV